MEDRRLLAVGPFPTPLEAVDPAGSLIYQGSVHAEIAAGGLTDGFTIDLDDRQTITAVVDPQQALRPAVEVFDPGGVSLGAVTAAAPGDDAVLQTLATTGPGTYSVTVAGAAQTTGAYTLRLVLGAAVEQEEHGGPTNDTPASAQDLDPSFVAVGEGPARRGAVLGSLPLHTGRVVHTEDFESGELDGRWTTYSSIDAGRVRVTDEYGAAQGSYAVLLDVGSNTYSLNEAIWTVDLSGLTEATLSFYHAEWPEGDTPFDGDFVDHYVADGVAISDDGINWHPVWNAVSQPRNEWRSYSVDLGAEALEAGMALGPNFRIKFQQYDNRPIPSDGRGYDEIVITTPTPFDDCYSLALQSGETVTLALTGQPSATMTMGLYDGQANLLATGSPARNVSQVITSFVAPSAGRYLVNVSGSDEFRSEYSLVATCNADFNVIPTGEGPLPLQDITLPGAVLGMAGLGLGEAPFTRQELVSTEGASAGDRFGHAVAASGHTAVVGSYYADPYLPDSGAADVFAFDGRQWRHRQRLTAADGGLGDQFGGSVAIDGEVVVVGAPYDDQGGPDCGAAYVFRFDGSRWQQQKLMPDDETRLFGVSVSVSGQTVMVGSYGDHGHGRDSGAVYVFQFDGSRWQRQQKLVADDAVGYAFFGHSVSVSGDKAIVGAFGDGVPANDKGSNSGAAYMFQLDAGRWQQQQKLAVSADGYEYFGRAVSISGRTAIVGADGDDDQGYRAGSAYIYRFQDGQWQRQQKIFGSGVGEEDRFGTSVSISGDAAIVGAHSSFDPYTGYSEGAAYVFGYQGGTWIENEKLDPAEWGYEDGFGCSVAIGGGTGIVGADRDGRHAPNAGSAYAFAVLPAEQSFGVRAGDTLTITTATPSDGPGEFVNRLDPAVELYDPQGLPVAEDDNGAPDGRNARLTHTAALDGTYTVRVVSSAERGEYLLQVAGHTAGPPPFAVADTNPPDGQRFAVQPATFTVRLNDALLLASLDVSDLIVDGVASTGVVIDNGRSVTFDLPGGLAEGWHTVQIAAGALEDLQGTPLEAFTSRFCLDFTAPRVTYVSVQEGEEVPVGGLTCVVGFDEAIGTALLEPSDVELIGSHSGFYSPQQFDYRYDPATGSSTLTLRYADLADDAYTLRVLSGGGRFEDLVGHDLDGEPLAFPIPPNVSGDGNPGGDFFVGFAADTDVAPYPLPLLPISPLGSLIYDRAVDATIGIPGDVDRFTIDLDDGQTISVVVDSRETLQPTVELFDPGGASLGSASAVAAGADALLQAAATTGPGTYTVAVAAAGLTTGTYTARVVLNAAMEAEEHDGPANDEFESAQDLSAAVVPLEGGAGRRGAVLGTLPTSTGIVVRSQDFESGFLGGQWSTYSSLPEGRIRVTGDHGTAAGSYALLMDVDGGGYNLNEAIWTVDLAGVPTPLLTFFQYEWSESDDGFDGDFTGHHDADGVAISDDGWNWHPVWYPGGSPNGQWQQHSIDLTAAAQAAGMTLGQNFRVKFQQYDNNPITGEGRGYDQIAITTPGPTEDWFRFSLQQGEAATLAAEGLSPGEMELELYDSRARLLALAAPTANADHVIHDFVAAAAGPYYARLSGNDADYSLAVVCDAQWDLEPNDGPAEEAQDIGLNGTVLGTLRGGTPIFTESEPNDDGQPEASLADLKLANQWWGSFQPVGGNEYRAQLEGRIDDGLDLDWDFFQVYASPGDTLRIFLDGDSLHDPYLRLFDNTARQIASDDDGGSGMNSYLVFSNFAYAGDFYVVADANGTDSGTYWLSATLIADNPIQGPPNEDFFRIELTADDQLGLATWTPAGGPHEFLNQLDPALELLDPQGAVVAADQDGAPDGRNAGLLHTAATSGTYTVHVASQDGSYGEYVLRALGHAGVLPPFELTASDVVEGDRFAVAPASFTADFSDSVLLSTLDASDLTVDGTPAVGLEVVDGDTVTFDLPDGMGEGWHTVRIAHAALADLQGTPIEEFSLQFCLDFTPPRVTYVSVQQGEQVSAGRLDFVAQFDEELDATFLDAGDVRLVGARTGSYTPEVFDFGYNPDDAAWQLSLQYAGLEDDDYSLTLVSGNGEFEDLAGHNLDGEPVLFPIPPNVSGNGTAGGDFVVNFVADVDVIPYPAPLVAKLPPGSLIYDPSLTGIIGIVGDSDSFTVELDAGQTISVAVDPQPSLWPRVELFDAVGSSLGFAMAATPGNDAVLQTMAVTQASTYTVTVSSVGGTTTGVYTVGLVLNAALEEEKHDGPPNNSIESAQNLNSSFIPLDAASATRGAVLGRSGSTGDWYRFTLQAGESATLALTSQTGHDVGLDLYDRWMHWLASAKPAENAQRVINGFLATSTGTYYAQVTGPEVDYSLLVTRNAEFDTEFNDGLQAAQQLATAGPVLGYLSGPPPGAQALKSAAQPDVGPAPDARNSAPQGGPSQHAYAPGRVIVRFADSADDARMKKVAANQQGKLLRRLPIINGAVIELDDPKADVRQAAAALAAQPDVLYAEVDYRVQALDTVPNDPLFADLWAMHNTGQTGGRPDADIDAPEAWDMFTGSASVVIAGIDTGIDYYHEDLAANMWVNPGEIPADGLDNDGNGYIDDVYGIDAANGDSNPLDDNYHGTHTAGTFGAVGNNGIGVAGVNWDVKIMAVKFLDSGGSGYDSEAIACLDYITMMKTDYGVNLVASNNSWGGGGFSQALRDAIEASNDAGIMFVAAAGNNDDDNDRRPHYPSSYDLDGLIAVAATDHSDNKASFSSYGLESVDLGAPGVNTLSTYPDNRYDTLQGTSMAAPHVAGAVAMLAAYDPSASLGEIKQAILDGTDPVSDLAGYSVSGGRLNLATAMRLIGDLGDHYHLDLLAGDTLLLSTTTPGSGDPFQFHNPLDPAIELYDPAGALVAADDNGAPDGRNAQLTYVAEAAGTYTVRVLSAAEQGEYVLHLSGSTAPLPPFSVAVTDPAQGQRVADSPRMFTVKFGDLIRPDSVEASDLTVDGMTALSINDIFDGDTVEFELPGLGDGIHNVAIAAGAIVDLQGTPLEPFAGQFILDLSGPRVVDCSIQEGDVVTVTPEGTLVCSVYFDEELTAANLDPSDATLTGFASGGHAPAVVDYAPAEARLTLQFAGVPEDSYTLRLISADGALEDLVGHDLDGEAAAWPIPPNTSGDGTPGGDFLVQFSVDANRTAAGDFVRLAPFGGLLSGSDGNAGRINVAGDTDDFDFFAEAGEIISAAVYPQDAAAVLSIELVGHSGQITAPGPGEPAVLPPTMAQATADLTVRVGGDRIATYELRLGKNFVPETVDSADGAELSLDASMIELGSGRYAVLASSRPGDAFASPVVWGVQPATGMILLIDPASAEVIHSFPAPDALSAAHTQIGLALARSEGALLYINSDVDPASLYRLNPTTGAVLSVETTDGLTYDGLGFDLGLLPGGIFFSQDMVEVRRQQVPSGPMESHLTTMVPSGAIGGDDAGRQFTYVPATNQIAEFDPIDAEIVRATLPSPEPHIEGLAFDGTQLYAASASGMLYTLDPNTGAVLEGVSIGGGPLFGLGAVGGSHTEDFESGFLGPLWTTYTSAPQGRIQVTGQHGTAAGSYALIMDVNAGGNYSLNEAIWTVNLSGVASPRLSFYQAEWADSEARFQGDFTGHFNADGVAISGDGVNWHPVWNAPDQANAEWVQYTIDLAAEAAAAGIVPGPNFRIKFQQYDNNPVSTDGRGYDEIALFSPAPAKQRLGFSPGGPGFVLPEVDEFQIDLTGKTGSSIDVILAGQGPADFSAGLLQLFDVDGVTVLATAAADPLGTAAENYDLAVLDFAVPADGVYTLRMTSTSAGDYAIVVTDSLVFDTESNDQDNALDDPRLRNLRPGDAALGALGSFPPPADSQTDRYEIPLAAGRTVVIHTQTPLDHPDNSPPNDLDPALTLYDSAGNLLVTDGDGQDGKNARLVFSPDRDDVYTIQVFSEGGAGEYLLKVDDAAAAEVVGRHVFYNNSAFDGGDPAAGPGDDDAIAPDKRALLPGQTATFANYTSYSRGLSGIMIDVAGLAGTPSAADFLLKAGNDDHPETWSEAPQPTSVTVRPGAGFGGSDRVTLIWYDGAIQGQWLQVTVLATANTGLGQADVFYFGNAVGDSGNSPADAKVTAHDVLTARDNQRGFMDPAPIDFFVDFDRNAKVNSVDMLIARNNMTHFLDALKLITPAAKTGDQSAALQADSARDAVFEQPLRREAPGRAAPSAKLHWLYDLQPAGPNRRSDPAGVSAAEAVDRLWRLE